MSRTEHLRDLGTKAEAFRTALLALCREHGFTIEHYRIEYDEYDSDEGFEIVPLTQATDFYQLEQAVLRVRR